MLSMAVQADTALQSHQQPEYRTRLMVMKVVHLTVSYVLVQKIKESWS